ncbi:DeoR/GlpR family DNA-binding transcription regulator [Leucobacter rhizosphaerae]|uniref:DeoR/GlpR family DNA-binding transcription regulator n=1 Tax=Leucobacter rhizosphaerae TaxID=2932245 RepID=A0ABY4FW18_9MICO|nr:DeoR/GlpR family DNA-binding transcription regulator [Leucobacter rhizosphaerae]UOQ60480.1 DeoR/GlpR family DNA-binding transcription regulator [Leucobacter rhizosphaerae]
MIRTAPERRERILGLLEGQEQVPVGALAEALGVSAVTIRKDLDHLVDSALVERLRGGARLRSSEEGPWAVRLGHRVAAKRAIARRAAELIGPNAVISLDSSSTGYYLALELVDRADITVVTNSLRVATQLAERSELSVVLLGGSVRRTAYSTVGFPPELLRGYGRIDTAFFGAAALSIEHGLLERSFSEAETKRAIAATAHRVVGLFDSSKSEGFGQHSVVPASAVAHLVTDDGFSESTAEAWRAHGVAVDRVHVPAGSTAP